jgi:hypothetical protein
MIGRYARPICAGLALVGGAANAQPAQRQFDLDCVGTSRFGYNPPREFRGTYHVDLIAARFCVDECEAQWPIASVTPQLIVLGERVERDEFNTNTSRQVYHPETRQLIASYVGSGPLPFASRTEAHCEVRPFTPFPTAATDENR